VSAALASVLELRDVSCRRGPAAVCGIDLAFAPGSFSLLTGAADSGHELLLRLLGLLEIPDTGVVLLEGAPVPANPEEARVKLRDRRLGFVFAAPFLLPAFSVIENVAMPLFKLSDVDPTQARSRSEALLDFVGLLEREQALCGTLAPFEQHRVSLARALVNEPAALLIENLDAALADEELRAFTALLRQCVTRFGVAVLATATASFPSEPADRVIELADGTLPRDPEFLPKAGA
jgi:ABC-type ATPase involved in cell division